MFEDVALHETVEHELVDVVGPGGKAFNPESRAVLTGFFGNCQQRWIEQFVAGRRRVDDAQRLQVRVDPVLER